MRTLVERFNVVIDQVVERRDATLVDLFSGALEAQREGTDANLVSRDGLHPSTEGHHAIAESFANELERP
jgi:lysophospholipase L1-like esterase